MKNKIYFLLSAIVFFPFVSFSKSTTIKDISRKQTKKPKELLIEEYLEMFEGTIKQALEYQSKMMEMAYQEQFKNNKEELNIVVKVVENFNIFEKMYSTIKQFYADNFTSEEMIELIEIQKNPVIVKLKNLQNEMFEAMQPLVMSLAQALKEEINQALTNYKLKK
jgi:hypothetical protein